MAMGPCQLDDSNQLAYPLRRLEALCGSLAVWWSDQLLTTSLQDHAGHLNMAIAYGNGSRGRHASLQGGLERMRTKEYEGYCAHCFLSYKQDSVAPGLVEAEHNARL